MTSTTWQSPADLTGASVRAMREQLKLSREQLSALAGFTGKSVARLLNIETKDSWKDGDREALWEAFSKLADPVFYNQLMTDRRGRRKGESGAERASRLQQALAANGHALPAFYDGQDDPPTFTPAVPPVAESAQIAARLLEGRAQVPPRAPQVAVGAPAAPAVTTTQLVAGLKVLSNSEVATWTRCRRKWWLTWYRKLALGQMDLVGNRATGGRVHRALAAYYVPDGQDRQDPRQALERAIVEDWTLLAQQAREHAHAGDVEEYLANLSVKFNDAVALERIMVEGYVQWLNETGADSNLQVTAAETALTADVMVDVPLDGLGSHVEKVPVQLIGKLDVRVRRTSDGARMFVDHKTVGNLNEPRKTLHMDPQMLHYHVLEWLNTPEGEARCEAALYNMLRRVKRTASANPPFYERIEVHHNEHELVSYHRRLLGAASDVVQAERRLAAGANPMMVAYPTPRRECAWDCDFFPVCPMFDDGSRVEDALNALYVEVDPMARYADTKGTGGI